MSTLSCDNIVKDYPGTRALDHVSASFDSGKINALLGKNGSGKSTLCKIFAGAESATSGEFYLDGQKLSFRNPTDAAKSGIVLVYQETSLVPTLTVMENIFMGRLPKKPGGLINWKLVQSETERLLKVMDVRINPKSKIMHLPMWQRQDVEICKALSLDPKVLILDEPTSALAKAEVEKLFAAIRKVKENDVIIIYISHKLAEIHEIADTVTVLRDAQYVGKKNIEEIENAGMIAMMFGKTEIRKRPADVVPTDEPVMEVKHLTRAGWYEDISFTLYKGEVLGIAGVLGSGRTELLGGIFGSDPADSGEVIIEGKTYIRRTPAIMKNAGLGLTPEDRKTTGLILKHSIESNLCYAGMKKTTINGWVESRKKRKGNVRAAGQGIADQAFQHFRKGKLHVRRQPAEGGRGQLAEQRPQDHDLRRTHQRHRCEREAADLRDHVESGEAGEFLHLCLHGAGRATRRLQPHSGAAGRKNHGGIDHGKDRFHDNKRFVYALYGRTFQ